MASKDSTGGATPTTGKAAQPVAEVEAFVVVMIPCQTFGLEDPRGSEGTPLVPQK